MMSFPSTLNRGGSNLQTTNIPSSIKDTLKASWQAAITQGKAAMTSGAELDTTGLRYNAEIDKALLLDNTNLASSDQVNFTHKADSGLGLYDDPLHMPLELIDVMNKYKTIMRKQDDLQYEHKPMKTGDDVTYVKNKILGGLSGSLFNPYYGLFFKGPTPETPLLTNKEAHFMSTEDCTIKRLVSLSNNKNDKTSPLGQARYKYADFMYCKDLGKYANNHLLTLRRFAFPVGDNIYTEAAMAKQDNNWSTMGDIGRLVTWFGNDDNKLEDILKYDYEATWKPLRSEINRIESKEGEGADTPGATKNLFNKAILAIGQTNYSYIKALTKGTNPALTLPFMSVPIPAGQYQNDPVVLGQNYDAHKVYEPANTIRETNIYDGELKFNQEFSITFNYTLRAYDNINPKAAFLDLLGNIMVVTYRRGRFWGGENSILGVSRDKSMWNIANNIIKKGSDTAKTYASQLLNGDTQEAVNSMKGEISNFWERGKALVNNFLNNADLSKLAINITNAGIDAVTGILQNHLGRPAIYQFNSILDGDLTGLWHLTVGNPLNPIMSIGNLIMTKAEVQHYGPLGIDDFPTGLKVTVSLKHAQPRDSARIEHMYTKGLGTIYQSLNAIKDINQVYSIGKPVINTGNNNNNTAKNTTNNTANNKDNVPNYYKEAAAEYNSIKSNYNEYNYLVINSSKDTTSLKTEEYNYLGDWDPERIQANRDQLA